MPFPVGLTKADNPSAWPSLHKHSLRTAVWKFKLYISYQLVQEQPQQEKFTISTEVSLCWARGHSLLQGCRESQRWSHQSHSPSSIPMHPLEKPRGANWLSCRREEIFKGRICTEVSTLRLKDSSPKPTIPSAEPLPDVALSASKHHETSCSTKYFLCTVDNSDLCRLQFCCAWATMLTDRPFSV